MSGFGRLIRDGRAIVVLLVLAVLAYAWVIDQRFVAYRLNEALEAAERAQVIALQNLSVRGGLIEREGGLFVGQVPLKGDQGTVDFVEHATGFGCTLFEGNIRIATTARAAGETKKRAIGTTANAMVSENVFGRGETFRGITETIGKSWVIIYTPLQSVNGRRVGMLATFRERDAFLNELLPFRATAASMLCILLLLILGLVFAARRQQRTIVEERSKADSATLRAEFYASLSHELRTPLVVISNLTHQLTGSAADQIREEAKELLELINNILDASKYAAGRMEIDRKPVSFPRLLDRIAVKIETLAAQKGLYVTVDALDPPQGYEGDALKLQQVMVNLLSNAIKFTEEGGVTLSVRDEPGHVLIEVSDTGIGMSDEARAVVFEPFRQADGGIERRYGGTGLGLSIVKSIVDAHGGTITVRSVVGEGSTFSVRLPRKTNATREVA